MCSIGSSTNSCAPLFDTLSLDAHLLELAVMLRETKQEGLAYFKTLSWFAPPAHQMAHLQERADTILRCVRSSRSGCTFVCLCSTADRTLLTLGRPLPRLTSGCSVLSFSFSIPSEFISWFSFPSLSLLVTTMTIYIALLQLGVHGCPLLCSIGHLHVHARSCCFCRGKERGRQEAFQSDSEINRQVHGCQQD